MSIYSLYNTGVSNYVNSIMVKINYEINLHSNLLIRRIVTEEFSASLEKIYRNNIVISDNINNNKKNNQMYVQHNGGKAIRTAWRIPHIRNNNKYTM